MSDADFVLDASLPLDPRKTVFVGGVPRPLKAGKKNNIKAKGFFFMQNFLENAFQFDLENAIGFLQKKKGSRTTGFILL